MGHKSNSRRWRSAVVVLIVAVLGVTGCAGSAPRTAEGGAVGAIKNRGRLIVGLKFDLPGFSARDTSTGRIEGFDAEISRLIAAAIFGQFSDSRIEFVEVLSRDREDAIRAGRVDLVISTYTITAARQKLVGFAGPYYVAGQDILVRRSDINITGVETLAGRRTCSVNGSTSLANVRTRTPTADTSVTFDRYSLCVAALLDGRVDAVTTDDAILLGFLRENPDQLRLVGRPFTTEPYGIGMPLGATGLRSVANAALAKAAANGAWKAIYERTIGKAGLLAPQPPELTQ